MIVTDGLYEIYGIRPEDFGGDLNSLLAPIHPDDLAVVTERAQLAAKQGVVVATEYRVVRPDGSIRFAWGVGDATWDDDGKPIKIVGAVQDITGRKELEGRLHHMQRINISRSRLPIPGAGWTRWRHWRYSNATGPMCRYC